MVFSPYLTLTKLLTSDPLLSDLGQNAWAALNDAHRTDLPIVHAPHMLALGAVVLASVICSRDIQAWLAGLQVDLDEVGLGKAGLLPGAGDGGQARPGGAGTGGTGAGGRDASTGLGEGTACAARAAGLSGSTACVRSLGQAALAHACQRRLLHDATLPHSLPPLAPRCTPLCRTS